MPKKLGHWVFLALWIPWKTWVVPVGEKKKKIYIDIYIDIAFWAMRGCKSEHARGIAPMALLSFVSVSWHFIPEGVGSNWGLPCHLGSARSPRAQTATGKQHPEVCFPPQIPDHNMNGRGISSFLQKQGKNELLSFGFQKQKKTANKPVPNKLRRERPKGVMSANVKAFLERREREEKGKGKCQNTEVVLCVL